MLGWIFLFVTSGTQQILYSVFALVTGIIAFFIWSKFSCTWPFAEEALPLTQVGN